MGNGNYWGLKEIKGDYWGLMEINGKRLDNINPHEEPLIPFNPQTTLRGL